jgi:hypothetical protein
MMNMMKKRAALTKIMGSHRELERRNHLINQLNILLITLKGQMLDSKLHMNNK